VPENMTNETTNESLVNCVIHLKQLTDLELLKRYCNKGKVSPAPLYLRSRYSGLIDPEIDMKQIQFILNGTYFIMLEEGEILACDKTGVKDILENIKLLYACLLKMSILKMDQKIVVIYEIEYGVNQRSIDFLDWLGIFLVYIAAKFLMISFSLLVDIIFLLILLLKAIFKFNLIDRCKTKWFIRKNSDLFRKVR